MQAVAYTWYKFLVRISYPPQPPIYPFGVGEMESDLSRRIQDWALTYRSAGYRQSFYRPNTHLNCLPNIP